jgi:hypothetical protein
MDKLANLYKELQQGGYIDFKKPIFAVLTWCPFKYKNRNAQTVKKDLAIMIHFEPP